VPVRPFDVILGRPTANSICLSLLSATDQTLSIAYGAGNAAPQTITASLQANLPEEITIPNLTPDTAYYYSVNNGEKYTFHTARAPGSTFTFTLQADSHLDSNSSLPVYQQTLANQRADQPDFVIDLGDTFMTDKVKPYTAAEPQYWAQRYYLSLIGQAAPLFLVLGNHDGEGAPRGSDGQAMSVWSAKLRTELFPNPGPDGFYSGNSTPDPTAGALQDYYAWTWGDALFVVLDPYWFTPPQRGDSSLWTPTLGETQYRWLKTTLEGSSAKWKFVFIHQLIGGYDKNGRGGVEVAKLYEWGGQNLDGSYAFDQYRPNWGVPIHQLLINNHVTAVFHGHDHLFVKQDLDGIIYQEVPQPSASRSNGTNSAAEYGYLSGAVLGSSGHLRVTVAPEQVTVDYVRSYLPQDETSGQQNGQVNYRYTIPVSGDSTP
jgi:predicted phosphodiesterase